MSFSGQVCGFQSTGHTECSVISQQMSDAWVFFQRCVTTDSRELKYMKECWNSERLAHFSCSMNTAKLITWNNHQIESLHQELLRWETAAGLEQAQQDDRVFGGLTTGYLLKEGLRFMRRQHRSVLRPFYGILSYYVSGYIHRSSMECKCYLYSCDQKIELEEMNC